MLGQQLFAFAEYGSDLGSSGGRRGRGKAPLGAGLLCSATSGPPLRFVSFRNKAAGYAALPASSLLRWRATPPRAAVFCGYPPSSPTQVWPSFAPPHCSRGAGQPHRVLPACGRGQQRGRRRAHWCSACRSHSRQQLWKDQPLAVLRRALLGGFDTSIAAKERSFARQAASRQAAPR